MFFVAFRKAGGKIDLGPALDELAALPIIDGTGPLSRDESYKEHMEYTSSVIKRLSIIGGPRCGKRNAFLSLASAVKFANKRYGVPMKRSLVTCEFCPTTQLVSKKPALSFQRKESDKLFSISSGLFNL